MPTRSPNPELQADSKLHRQAPLPTSATTHNPSIHQSINPSSTIHFGSVLLCALVLQVFCLPSLAQNVVTGPGINFSTLTGPNGAPYNGDTEGDFTVTPTAGQWFQALVYGGPPPSIYVGPVNSPGVGVLSISDRAGRFTFSSFDYSSNNGDSTYDVEGFLGATLEFDETGSLSGSFAPNFGFLTQTIGHSSTQIDGLQIEISPGAGVTSVNLDNIMVATVPEPTGFSLLALGAAASAFFSRLRSKREANEAGPSF